VVKYPPNDLVASPTGAAAATRPHRRRAGTSTSKPRIVQPDRTKWASPPFISSRSSAATSAS